jgi:hypothetical protein
MVTGGLKMPYATIEVMDRVVNINRGMDHMIMEEETYGSKVAAIVNVRSVLSSAPSTMKAMRAE